MMEEAHARVDESGASVKGHYHKWRLAEYRYGKFKHCTGGGCWKRWESIRWTGEMEPMRTDWEGQTPFEASYADNRQFDVSLNYGDQEWYDTNSQSAQTWKVGFRLAGLSLNSQAGYSRITRLRWDVVGSCQQDRHLFGSGEYVSEAKVIFAHSPC